MTNLITAVVTFYCAGRCCCGVHADGITASGKPVQEGITIAAPRSVPFGTRVYVDGIGWRTVQDRMSPRYPNRWDVYMHNHNQARKAGISRRKIWIVKEVKK